MTERNWGWTDPNDIPEKRNPKSTTKRDVLTKKRLVKAMLTYKTTGDLATALSMSNGSISRALKKYGLVLKEKGRQSVRLKPAEKTGSAKADLGKVMIESDKVRALIKQDHALREMENGKS